MRYQIKGLRRSAGLVALTLDAADEAEARRQARDQGVDVLSVRAQRAWLSFGAARRERFPLVLFSQEFMSLLDAGLTMVESLETLAEKEQATATGKVLHQVLGQLYEGRTLSHALEQFPHVFPPLYIASVRASEKTGDLKEALARYVEYHAQMDRVRGKIVSASIYPALLILVGGLVTMFLMLYVVPKFSHIYEDIGTDLPALSQVLIQWGKLLEGNATATLGTLAAVVGFAVWGATRPALRRWLMPRLWSIPAVGERMRVYELARFYRTLGMLLESGIPVVAALDMSGGMLSPALRGSMERAARAIREGSPVSKAMLEHGLTTPVSLRMLRVGERSGRMGRMMERIAVFYEEEMARWVDWFTRLFEPILMAVIGVAIGVIVLLLYLPIFELAGSIQ